MAHQLAALGFGCSGLMSAGSSEYRQRLLATAFDHGIRHFDVAPTYGSGFAEAELAKFIESRRDQVFICTKFGMVRPTPAQLVVERLALQVGKGSGAVREWVRRRRAGRSRQFDLPQVKASVESSFRALRTDRIDLLLLHDPLAEDSASSALIEYLQSLKAAGRIGDFGVSGEPEEIARTLSGQPGVYGAIQFENSIVERNLRRLSVPAGCRVITHRSVHEGVRAWAEALQSDPDRKKRLEKLWDIELPHAQAAMKVAFACSLRENAGGTVLFSSHSADRIRNNADVASGNTLPVDVLDRILSTDLQQVAVK